MLQSSVKKLAREKQDMKIWMQRMQKEAKEAEKKCEDYEFAYFEMQSERRNLENELEKMRLHHTIEDRRKVRLPCSPS